MRHLLPLLLLAGCAFDTGSMPGDVQSFRINDPDEDGDVEALADAAQSEDAAIPADAEVEAAGAAAPPPEREDAGEVELDAAAPEDAAAPPGPEDVSSPELDAATVPPTLAVCRGCTLAGDECGPGLTCGYSLALTGRRCLPVAPSTGTCADLCPGLPVLQDGFCNPANAAGCADDTVCD